MIPEPFIYLNRFAGMEAFEKKLLQFLSRTIRVRSGELKRHGR